MVRGQQAGRRLTEAEIQKQILEWLNTLPAVLAWRRNVGGMVLKNLSGKSRMIRFGVKGMSDVEGMVHGVHLEIEVKAPGKSPTLEQFLWLSNIRAKGGIAFWAQSLDEAIAALRGEFTERGWAWNRGWEIS